MAIYTQTLSKTTHFTGSGGVVDLAAFESEIHGDKTLNDGVGFLTVLDGSADSNDDVFLYWRETPPQEELDQILVLAAAHTGEPLIEAEEVAFPANMLDSEGNLKTSSIARPGSEAYFFTHNYCDPCTWYQGAVQCVDVELTQNGAPRVWKNTDHPNWIDITHGRIFNEDALPEQATHIPSVEYSTDGGTTWNALTENSWGDNDGDFNIEYELGEIHLNKDLAATNVRATFYKAASAMFTIKPKAGRLLRVKYVETQYEADIEMTTNLVFEIWMYAAALATVLQGSDDPAEVAQGDGLMAAIQAGHVGATDMMRAVVRKYKRLQDFYIESTGPFPVIPRHGNKGDRAMPADLYTIPFQYLADQVLSNSAGVEVRIFNENNKPFKGSFGNSTFYCISERE